MKTPRRLALVLGFPLAIASILSLAQCDSDGVTPICPNDGGDCVTPPGTSTASVVITTGGTAGTNAGGSGGGSSTAGSSGSGGSKADGGILSVLDAALADVLGQ
jgi:hypothetical protein